MMPCQGGCEQGVASIDCRPASPRRKLRRPREALEVVVLRLPGGVHETDTRGRVPRGRLEPASHLLRFLVVVAGDEDPVPTPSEPVEALGPLAVIPGGDDDLAVETLPGAREVAADEVVVLHRVVRG